MPSEKTITKSSETRRSTKPIMEKRRRARINNSLSELKNLILDALKKDNARHSKLEKADILEMTVKHLQNLQMQQMQPDPTHMAKFRAGFAECANEVSRFMGRTEGMDHTVRQRLLNHLANCLTGMNNPAPLAPIHVQVGTPAPAETETPSNRLYQGVQLVPTRLANGDIAFLLPANLSVYEPSSHVPISPASSTSSVSSPMSMPSSMSPVHILGSSGILSPASSDRCTPSPVIMHTAALKREMPHPVQTSQHCPVIVPTVNYQIKTESKSVWRPF